MSAACGNPGTKTLLNQAETCMEEHPDSALAVIRAIDTNALHSRALHARYSLLHATALDKNWIDTTDVGVVMPAVEWYGRHGDADQRMKTYYYLGRIQENYKDLPAAIVSFITAEEASEGSKDIAFKGLLDLGIANIYRKSHNALKTLEYTERGKTLFTLSCDTSHLNLIDGRLAMAYQENKEWEKADSLYQICMRLSSRDTGFFTIYLSQYALFKVLKPDPDPAGAIELLNRRRVDYGKRLTIKDYGVYAYASALSGDFKTCDAIIAMIEGASPDKRLESRYLEYRILEEKKDYPRALQLLKDIYTDQDSVVTQLLNHSVTKSIQEYTERKSVESKMQMKRHRNIWVVSIIILTLFSTAMFLWISLRRRKEKDKAEELLRSAEEANRLLKLSNVEMETSLGILQKTFVQFYHEELERMGSLCEAFIKARGRKDEGGKEAVYRRVEKIVESINKNDESYARFKRQVNNYLDNAVDDFLEDLGGNLTPDDERYICYSIAGFDSKTLSMLLGLSLPNVYTKRTRLRDRIRLMDSPKKERYLAFFEDKR